MKLSGHTCEHPTIAGKPCVICAAHYPALPADGGEVGSDTTLPGTDDMHARFAWIEAQAADMGYVLVPEPQHPDSPHASEATPSTAGSVREALEKACRNILPYLRWTIGPESPGHHPTMPSAVAAFEAALSAPVEAPVAVKRPVLVDDQNSASGKRVEWHATPHPLPSVDEGARLIDPTSFSIKPSAYGLASEAEVEENTWAGSGRKIARDKATAILTLLGGSAHGR